MGGRGGRRWMVELSFQRLEVVLEVGDFGQEGRVVC